MRTSTHRLRASISVGGRALTLNEEIHPHCLLGNPRIQERYFHTLAGMLPSGAAPIIIADAGLFSCCRGP